MSDVRRFKHDFSKHDQVSIWEDVVLATDYNAETARADRAEAAYKDLAQIVEGLPKYDEIVTKDHVVTVSVYDENNAHYRIECPSPQCADALARLLAWRFST